MSQTEVTSSPNTPTAGWRMWDHSVIRSRIIEMLYHPESDLYDREPGAIASLIALNKATFETASTALYEVIREQNLSCSIFESLFAAGASDERIRYYANKVRYLFLDSERFQLVSLDIPRLVMSYPSIVEIKLGQDVGLSNQSGDSVMQLQGSSSDSDISIYLQRGNNSAHLGMKSMSICASVEGTTMGAEILWKNLLQHCGNLTKIPVTHLELDLQPSDTELGLMSKWLPKEMLPDRDLSLLDHLSIFGGSIRPEDLSSIHQLAPAIRSLGFSTRSIGLSLIKAITLLWPNLTILDITPRGSLVWEIDFDAAVTALIAGCPKMEHLALPIPHGGPKSSTGNSGTSAADLGGPIAAPGLARLHFYVNQHTPKDFDFLDLQSQLLWIVAPYCQVEFIEWEQAMSEQGSPHIILLEKLNAGRRTMLEVQDRLIHQNAKIGYRHLPREDQSGDKKRKMSDEDQRDDLGKKSRVGA